jgi:hypothetical protein
MNVVLFPDAKSNEPGVWGSAELNQVVASFGPGLQNGQADSWEAGITEVGDPQVYLIGPPPDHDCVLCVSRLGSLYILEDGAGQVLFEHNSLLSLAEAVKRALRHRHARFVARLALFWCALRETLHERTEAMIGEGEDLLVHVAPQLAAII